MPLPSIIDQQLNRAKEKMAQTQQQVYSTLPSMSKYNLDQNSLMSMLQKMFGQNQSNLSGTMQRAGSGAGMNAFSQGASMGLNNPFSLQQRARNSTMSQFAPQFGEMQSNYLNQAMNLPFQVNQFNRQGAQMDFGNQMTFEQLLMQQKQMQLEQDRYNEENSPFNTIAPSVFGMFANMALPGLSGKGLSGKGLSGMGSGYPGGTGMNSYIPRINF